MALKKPWVQLSRAAAPQPGDEAVGEWSALQLIEMDRRFVARMQRAIARGEERPQLSGYTGLTVPKRGGWL
jgi:hypothetical protein